MKLVIAWVALVVLAVATAGSCSISSRSGEFTCVTNADCQGPAAGRVCSSDGFCVGPGSGSGIVDAPMGTRDTPRIADADLCPSQCTSCDLGSMTCTILCGSSGNCNNDLSCPAGFHCNITCGQHNACPNIDCSAGASCNVTCGGSASCQQVQCGPGPCKVACTGNEACQAVSCGNFPNESCACDVSCGSNASCQQVTCSHFACDTANGCSSSISALCNTCP